MSDNGQSNGEERIVVEVINHQLQHFRSIDPPCRGLGLPDGILLRHTQSKSLYFYLRTDVDNGKLRTRVFASDSPYERQQAGIGTVVTPMFDPGADSKHLEKLEGLIREWVDFVQEAPDLTHEFHSFKVDARFNGNKS